MAVANLSQAATHRWVGSKNSGASLRSKGAKRLLRKIKPFEEDAFEKLIFPELAAFSMF